MNRPDAITIETVINAPADKVWECLTLPEHIVRWAFASPDWEAPSAENDVRVGGRFKTVMAAKDKSAQFDFSGVYTDVRERARIEYDLDDGRHVKTELVGLPDGVQVRQTFDPETTNSLEKQRAGWQAILNNFKRYVETNK
jgi:uncharacterized protein YndB with AHSA1/START domain